MGTLALRTVVDRFRAAYTAHQALNDDQRRAVRAILACLTEALGVQRRLPCHECGLETVRYCSCRNRHCPRCQQGAAWRWVERQRDEVLQTTYYHLVFTLPHELDSLARQQPRLIYGGLFEAVWHTLACLGRQRLGSQLGMTAVLHTWGQTLSHHVHLHCLIPAGAFDARQGRWHRARCRYLFPVKVMQRMFRGRYVCALRAQASRTGLSGTALTTLLSVVMDKTWNVHARPVLGHAPDVLAYLGRYTHRIAIAESRLIAIDADQVMFRYRDYRQDGRTRVMSLDGTEFLRRYLTHVLPRGFQRVRHYGFLGNRVRATALSRINALLGTLQKPRTTEPERFPVVWTCPGCGARNRLAPAGISMGADTS